VTEISSFFDPIPAPSEAALPISIDDGAKGAIRESAKGGPGGPARSVISTGKSHLY